MTEFMGFVRPDGSVGTRNHLLILSGTVYSNKLAEKVASMIHGAVALTHPLGRCQVRPDLRMTRRFLSNSAINPNVGAVVVIDHFREEGMTAEDIAHDIQSASDKPVATVNTRSAGGFISAFEKTLRYAADYSRMLSDLTREPVPLSKLLFGTDICAADGKAPLAGFLKELKDSGKLSAEAFEKIAGRNAKEMLGL